MLRKLCLSTGWVSFELATFCRYARAWFGSDFDRSSTGMRPAPLNPYFARWVGRARPRAPTARPRALFIFSTVSGTAKALALEVRSRD